MSPQLLPMAHSLLNVMDHYCLPESVLSSLAMSWTVSCLLYMSTLATPLAVN